MQLEQFIKITSTLVFLPYFTKFKKLENSNQFDDSVFCLKLNFCLKDFKASDVCCFLIQGWQGRRVFLVWKTKLYNYISDNISGSDDYISVVFITAKESCLFLDKKSCFRKHAEHKEYSSEPCIEQLEFSCSLWISIISFIV